MRIVWAIGICLLLASSSVVSASRALSAAAGAQASATSTAATMVPEAGSDAPAAAPLKPAPLELTGQALEWSKREYDTALVDDIEAAILKGTAATGETWGKAVAKGGGSSAAVEGLSNAFSVASGKEAALTETIAGALAWGAETQRCQAVVDACKVAWGFLEKPATFYTLFSNALLADPAVAKTCIASAVCSADPGLSALTASAVGLACPRFRAIWTGATDAGTDLCGNDKFAATLALAKCVYTSGTSTQTVVGGPGKLNEQAQVTPTSAAGAGAIGGKTLTRTTVAPGSSSSMSSSVSP